MKKFLEKSQSDKKYHKIMGIDPSTKKMAFILVQNFTPVQSAYVDLGEGDIYERLLKLRKYYPALIELWNPDFVCIEQAIFIQNPETSRKIAYCVGVVAAETMIKGIKFEDVAPSSWKSYLGVKPVTAVWKKEILATLGDKDGKREIQKIRKGQTQKILGERFPDFDWSDEDISDACGIALYAYSKHGIDSDGND